MCYKNRESFICKLYQTLMQEKKSSIIITVTLENHIKTKMVLEQARYTITFNLITALVEVGLEFSLFFSICFSCDKGF